jgi:hypothetical protein
MILIMMMTVILIAETALIEPWPSLENSARLHSILLLGFRSHDDFMQQGRDPCVQPPDRKPKFLWL